MFLLQRSPNALSIAATLALLIITASPQPANAEITGLQRVASGLSNPMFVTHAPGDINRLFIGERGGSIRILNLDTGSLEPDPFLSIPSVDAAGEGGLLGLAFHPDYQTNGLFYVNVTIDNGGQNFQGATSPFSTHIRQYSVSDSDPNIADPAPTEILSFLQPQTNHNAGWIGFHPTNGYLYIPTGDGGGGNDTGNGHTPGTGNAQDLTDNFLGKILRIDVNSDDFLADPDRNYHIPDDNPFAGATTGDDEIWALGLRNPFRDSFDRATADLWLGDVGQSAREEIDFLPTSSTGEENFGWRLREGTIATPSGGVGGPPPPNNVNPVFDYPRTGAVSGKTVIGGYVYRGPDPDLHGLYFFADAGDFLTPSTNKFWTFNPANPSATVADIKPLLTPDAGSPSYPVSFGEDALGNLYIVYLASNDVYRITTQGIFADFNFDGFVDGADFSFFLSQWGDTGALSPADFNNDNTVDGSDFSFFLTQWNPPPPGLTPPGVVPEPATALLLFLAALPLLRKP